MATNNPVRQVLVPAGNQALPAVNTALTSILIGQLGIYNLHTGLAVSAASPVGDLQDVFIAVGVDVINGGANGAAATDIVTSAGQYIPARLVKSNTLRGYMSTLPQIDKITGYVAKCEKDYVVKIEFRNEQSYLMNGSNQFSKSFNFYSGCCADQCTDCGDGDPAALAAGLVANINADLDGLVTAALSATQLVGTINTAATADGNVTVTIGTKVYTVAILDLDTATQAAAKIAAAINADADNLYKATSLAAVLTVVPVKATLTSATILVYGAGTTGSTMNAIATTESVAITDAVAFAAAYPGVSPTITLTSAPTAVSAYVGNIDLNWVDSRETVMVISLTAGFECNGTVTSVQTVQYAEGTGRQVRHWEYMAGGLNGKPGPYRTSSLTGTERRGFQYFASDSGTYQIASLTYDIEAVGGWEEYKNNLETIIAFPCADTTTLTGFYAVLDVILATRFPAMTNDAALLDCTNAKTSTLGVTTNGIQSLA